MVVTRIIGGLGNQMFQYACGRALAERNKVPLLLDLQGFEKYKLHQYMMEKFSISAQPCSVEHVPRHIRLGPLTITRPPKSKQPGNFKYFREKSFAFDPAIISSGQSNVYLDGYWQSEKYFLSIRDIILKEFQLAEPLDEENKQMVDRLSASDTIALHVRRTDYVNNSVYASCSLDYYRRALDVISQQTSQGKLFIFSDDPAWVEKNMKFDLPTTYVTHNVGKANYKDLVLMSKAAHNIIANSSFSWWGGWLKTRTDGMVIAPNTWYTDPTKNSLDIYSPAWKTLPI